MSGTPIVIFKRDTPNDFVERFCMADGISMTHKSIVFISETPILPQLGRSYLVRSAAPQEGKPEQMRELEIPRNSASGKPPYTYAVPLGQAWSGYVGAPPVEEKKANDETEETVKT